MAEEVSTRMSVADVLGSTNISINTIWAMFLDNSVRFYLGDTLLTFEERPPLTSRRLRLLHQRHFFDWGMDERQTWYAQYGRFICEDEQSRAEYEAGMLVPDFDNADDRREVYASTQDVVRWFKEKSREFVVKVGYEHIWKGVQKEKKPAGRKKDVTRAEATEDACRAVFAKLEQNPFLHEQDYKKPAVLAQVKIRTGNLFHLGEFKTQWEERPDILKELRGRPTER